MAEGEILTIETVVAGVVTTEQLQVIALECEAEVQVVASGAQGPQGIQGLTGPAGGASLEFNFAYGDATPATIITATAGKLVYGVAVHIKTPFDGVGAALVVGDAAQADRLMTTSENDPTQIGANATHPAHAYVADTALLLGITPGAGATQGAGVLVLYIQQ